MDLILRQYIKGITKFVNLRSVYLDCRDYINCKIYNRCWIVYITHNRFISRKFEPGFYFDVLLVCVFSPLFLYGRYMLTWPRDYLLL